MDSGCYVMVTYKNMLGKVNNFKKWLLHCFAAKMHKNEKFAANAVNQRFMGRLA